MHSLLLRKKRRKESLVREKFFGSPERFERRGGRADGGDERLPTLAHTESRTWVSTITSSPR